MTQTSERTRAILDKPVRITSVVPVRESTAETRNHWINKVRKSASTG